MEISEKRLKELRRAEEKLTALERGGVDNWQGYEDALAEYWATTELEETKATLLDEIIQILGENAYEPSERGAGIAFSNDAEDMCMKVMDKFGVIFKKDGE